MIIRIENHTLEQAEERGVSRDEIVETLKNGVPFTAKYGRIGKFKVFPFGKVWRGKYKAEKKVEVIYTIEKDSIITVTVYAYYGMWEAKQQ